MAKRRRSHESRDPCRCEELLDKIPWGVAARCPVHGKVWIPCCFGSLYDLDGCTCADEEKMIRRGHIPRNNVREIGDRLDRIEALILKLTTASLSPREAEPCA